MDYSRNVINDNSVVYLEYDYLMFPVNLQIAPEFLLEDKAFYSKRNYHVSLLCLEGIPELEQIKILKLAQKYNLKLGKIINTYKVLIDKERQSIIVRVRFTGLKRLILAVNKNLGYHFTYPPTHVTLYTLKGQTGIGINTFERYRQISGKIGLNDMKRLEKSFRLI